MTSRDSFSDDEWDLVIRTPRWVVAAASAAQRDVAYRTENEVEAGYVATAKGQFSGNAFITQVAAETMMIFDRPAGDALDRLASAAPEQRAAGLDAVLDAVAAVHRLLAQKADAADAKVYRRWLVEITDVVITAARSKDILGFGGQLVTAAEQGFRDRLVLALQR